MFRVFGRPAVLGLAILALTGCETLSEIPILEAVTARVSGSVVGELPADGIRQFSVRRDAINLVGPSGYCIDTPSSNARGGFAIFASCAVVSQASDLPKVAGVLTAQVGDADSAFVTGAEAELADLISSPEGAQTLSSANDNRVKVGATEAGAGVFFVQITKEGGNMLDGVQSTSWRAFLDLKGRAVTLSALSLTDNPMTEEQGLALLKEMVTCLRAANVTSET